MGLTSLWVKIFKASPDHGTALDLIKKKANPLSLIKCINFLINLKNDFSKKSLGQNFAR